MPNGSVPLHMVLHPQGNLDYVIYCRGGALQVFSREKWDEKKAQAEPLFVLTESEGIAIAWFLKYWLGDSNLKPGYNMRDIHADFDF